MNRSRTNDVARRAGGAAVALLVVATLVSVAIAQVQAERTSYLGPEAGETLTSWTQRWLDGPVQYIATEDEIERYEGLDSTAARLHFIRLFWERRDPVARNATNEYYDEYVRRVEYANERFGEGQFANGGQEGWRTPFGRVVLILGEPERTRRETGFAGTVSNRPAILWGYDERLPSPWPSNENLLFVFQRGRWRLAPPSTFTEPAGPGSAARELERVSNFAEIPNDFLRVTSTLVDESLLQTVNYNDARETIVGDVVFPEAEIPFAWESSFAPGEGGNVAVTLELSWRIDSLVFHVVDDNYETEMNLSAVVFDGDGEVAAETSAPVNVVIPEAELAARGGEIVQHALRLELAPGNYTLRLALDDLLLGYRSVYNQELIVPSR